VLLQDKLSALWEVLETHDKIIITFRRSP